jgi:hypothetical protein
VFHLCLYVSFLNLLVVKAILTVSLDRPLRDNFNAAQSGGMAMNLDYELDYLIPRKA